MITEYEKVKMQGIKEDFLKETGKFIARKRKYCGLNQKELGAYMDVAATTVSRYETGDIEIPGSNLAIISSVCGFPMREYINAWDCLELRDIFKKSLELIRYGKQRPRTDYTGHIPSVSLVKEPGHEYIAIERPDTEMVDVMVSVCTEDEKEDLILIGTALESLEDEDLQQKLTTVVMEHHITGLAESDVKRRIMAYYEAYTSRILDKK